MLWKGQDKVMEMEGAEWHQATHLARGEPPGSKAEGNNPRAQVGKLSGAQGRAAEAKMRAGCVDQCWGKEVAEGVAGSGQRKLHPMGNKVCN